jgi:telomere length regulation protein
MAIERSRSAFSQGGGDGETSLEALALDKVAETADAIAEAASAGEVVRAIHAVAALLFPVDSVAVAGETPPTQPPPAPIPHLSIVPLGVL